MKTVITDINMHKVAITADGEMEIILLATGKKFSGQLSVEELEQLNYRIVESTEGAINFDPPPQDLIQRHASDLITLEEQATELERLREVNAQLQKASGELITEFETYRKEHEETDTTMAGYRAEIMGLKGQLFEVQGELERLKTVHNERSKHSAEAKPREVTSTEPA